MAAQHLGEVGARTGVLGGSGQVERGRGRVEVRTWLGLGLGLGLELGLGLGIRFAPMSPSWS